MVLIHFGFYLSVSGWLNIQNQSYFCQFWSLVVIHIGMGQIFYQIGFVIVFHEVCVDFIICCLNKHPILKVWDFCVETFLFLFLFIFLYVFLFLFLLILFIFIFIFIFFFFFFFFFVFFLFLFLSLFLFLISISL